MMVVMTMVCTDACVVMMVSRDNSLYSCRSVKMTVDQDVQLWRSSSDSSFRIAVITQGN